MPLAQRLLSLCCLVFLTSASLAAQTTAVISQEAQDKASPAPGKVLSETERKDVMRKAREAYYGLKAIGLDGFRFHVVPDWDETFKGLPTDAVAREQLLPLLKKTQVTVIVGPDGASNVSHSSDDAPPSEEVAGRMRKTVGGMEQMLTGFLQTWTGFTLAPIFPGIDSIYQIEDLGNTYRMTYKETNADVLVEMDRDFAISRMKVTTSEFVADLQPTWDRGKTGLLLTDYKASYHTIGSAAQEVSITIGYGDVGGFRLPKSVTATVHLPAGTVVVFPLAFTNIEAKKR